MTDPLDMSGHAVIVTGGCRGIGRGITIRFLEHGADVVICCRHEPEQLPRAGDRAAVFVAADVREPDDIDRVVTTTTGRFGRLDVVINNAGGSPAADAATASPRFSTAIITLNLIAPLNVSQRANAVMQEQDGGGSIINISSVRGEGRVAPAVGSDERGVPLGRLHLLDVDAGVEAASVRAEDHDPHRGIGAQRPHEVGQLEPPGHRQRADRRVVHHHLGDAVGDRVRCRHRQPI